MTDPARFPGDDGPDGGQPRKGDDRPRRGDDRPYMGDDRSSEGGDPACWLARVCPECGLFAEYEPPTVCVRCGAHVPFG